MEQREDLIADPWRAELTEGEQFVQAGWQNTTKKKKNKLNEELTMKQAKTKMRG